MSRSSIRRVVPCAALVAAGLVAACSDASPTAVSGTGRLAVYLTDAPGDVLKAVVTIDRGYVEVEGESGATSIYASSPSYAGLPEGATVAGALQMPSFAQSGLKVQFTDGLVVGGDDQHLLVDFDVRESFGKQAGNSGSWVMTPVLKGSRLEAAPAADSTTAPADSATGA